MTKAAAGTINPDHYTPRDVERVMHAALFTPRADGRWGLVIVWKGPPGIGKSAAARRVSAQCRLELELLALGERGEGALGVTPVPKIASTGEQVMSYPPPDWTLKFRNDTYGLVFVDEANQLPPALKPYILGLLLDARIGGAFLGRKVRIMGALNPPEISAGGWEMTPPEANRCGWLYWPVPSEESWGDWLMGGASSGAESKAQLNPGEEEARVMAAWPSAFAKAGALVSNFVKKFPDKLMKMPVVGSQAISGPWPSPRTCEMAARALASSWIHKLAEDDTDTLIAAFVGRGWADEFYTWRKAMDLPDPAELLDGKIKWAHNSARVDVTSVVLAACAGLVTPVGAENRKARVTTLWKLLETVLADAKDEVVGPTKALAVAGLTRGFPDAIEVLAELSDVLKAAGIIA